MLSHQMDFFSQFLFWIVHFRTIRNNLFLYIDRSRAHLDSFPYLTVLSWFTCYFPWTMLFATEHSAQLFPQVPLLLYNICTQRNVSPPFSALAFFICSNIHKSISSSLDLSFKKNAVCLFMYLCCYEFMYLCIFICLYILGNKCQVGAALQPPPFYLMTTWIWVGTVGEWWWIQLVKRYISSKHLILTA